MDEEKWYTHAVRAKAQYQSGNMDVAKQEYAAAIACENATTSLMVEYAEFLVDNNIEGVESPFASWNEDEKLKNPITYAYDIYLKGEDVLDIGQRLENTVAYNPDALLVLAKAALKQDHVNTAENLLDRAMRYEPEHPVVKIYRGIVALKQSNITLANSLLQPESQNGKILTESDHARIGLMLWHAGQTEYALKHFQLSGAQVPALPDMALKLAGYYLDQNDCEKAKELIYKNVLTFAENKEKSFELAKKAKQCGDLETAAELYGAVLDNDFQNMEARVNLADIYVSRGEKNRAIQLYDGFFKLNPKNAFSLAKVAEIHHQFDTKDTAIQILNYILQNENQFEDISYAKELEAKWKSGQLN
jgi:predicted Zn-dependent protease